MIRIEIDDREVSQALERLQRRVGDMTPAMEDIGEMKQPARRHTPVCAGVGSEALAEASPLIAHLG